MECGDIYTAEERQFEEASKNTDISIVVSLVTTLVLL